jgi:hypothetical protein
MLNNAPSLLGVQRSCSLLYAAPRTHIFVKLIGIVGCWFHFACDFGRGQCAPAFRVLLLKRQVADKTRANHHTKEKNKMASWQYGQLVQEEPTSARSYQRNADSFRRRRSKTQVFLYPTSPVAIRCCGLGINEPSRRQQHFWLGKNGASVQSLPIAVFDV